MDDIACLALADDCGEVDVDIGGKETLPHVPVRFPVPVDGSEVGIGSYNVQHLSLPGPPYTADVPGAMGPYSFLFRSWFDVGDVVAILLAVVDAVLPASAWFPMNLGGVLSLKSRETDS